MNLHKIVNYYVKRIIMRKIVFQVIEWTSKWWNGENHSEILKEVFPKYTQNNSVKISNVCAM